MRCAECELRTRHSCVYGSSMIPKHMCLSSPPRTFGPEGSALPRSYKSSITKAVRQKRQTPAAPTVAAMKIQSTPTMSTSKMNQRFLTMSNSKKEAECQVVPGNLSMRPHQFPFRVVVCCKEGADDVGSPVDGNGKVNEVCCKIWRR